MDRRVVTGLIRWFEAHRRDLPWRRRRSPWRTWVSEVMLQQTTADVVARRFESFVRRFPGPSSLARAPLRAVLAEWSGLGYYRRARLLHAAARDCVAKFGGEVPESFADLRSLPGIGEYTAGAVASLGFGVPEPAVDGNVARVWSRFEAEAADPASASDRRRLAALLKPWIPEDRAGAFNEALIELGATVCRPVEPRCEDCPIRRGCLAFQREEVSRYPGPSRRRASVAITSARGVLRDGAGRVLVVRRPASASLLAGFDELPGRWLAPGEEPEAALADVFSALGYRDVRIGGVVSSARHVITHHRIRSVAFEVAARRRAGKAGARFVGLPHLSGVSVTTETRKLAAAATGAH